MRTSTTVALVAMLTLTGAGCTLPGVGGSSSPPPAAPSASAPASAPASAESTGTVPSASSAASSPTDTGSAASDPTPADPSQPSAGDQLGRVVARRTSATNGRTLTLNLYGVERNGATSHVNFTASSPATGGGQGQVTDLFSDGNFTSIDKEGDAADGLQLVDGKNAKLYLVASDGRGQCLCSRNLSNVFLRNNLPVLFSATFAAPPAGVTQVDVRIPNFGTVKNVPVA